MKDTITRNTSTSYEIVMKPEDAIDVAILEAMSVQAAINPSNLSFAYKDGVCVVAIQKTMKKL